LAVLYLGVTEHGNVETENESFLIKGYDFEHAGVLVAPPQPANGGE
jgi:hypothetical protein